MPIANANGLTFEYETHGNPENQTVLLIMGLGAQLTSWPMGLIQQIVDSGYHVVRFDNRDIGLSSKFDNSRIPNPRKVVLQSVLGFRPNIPYTLMDMARDTIGILDALNIEKAHLVGVSMGGMISQLIAGHFPERVLTLTSIMSTTGNRFLPQPTRRARKALLTPHPNASRPQAVVERNMKVLQTLQGSKHFYNPEVLRASVTNNFNRSHYPSGSGRQLVAAIASPDRRKLLSSIELPTAVIHGDEDPLVRVECGIDTAKHLPNSELHIVKGMGHGLPDTVIPQVADAITSVLIKRRL